MWRLRDPKLALERISLNRISQDLISRSTTCPACVEKQRMGDQNLHTTSRPLPLSILSVVATTFPPFRCRSHIIFRRDTCGNICCILSTSASLARMLFADVALLLCDDGVAFDEKKKYLIARPASRSRINSCGRFMVCSSIVFTLCASQMGI